MYYSKVTIRVAGGATEVRDFGPSCAEEGVAGLDALALAVDDDAYLVELGENSQQSEEGRLAQEATTRKMRGLTRKKRKFSRRMEAKKQSDQKVTSYNYQTLRLENNLPPTAPSRHVIYTLCPPTPKSPFKKELKKTVMAMELEDNRKESVILGLKRKSKTSSKKISALKKEIKEVRSELVREKRVSNKLIEQGAVEAEAAIEEAYSIMRDAMKQKEAAEKSILKEKERNDNKLRKERVHSKRQLSASECVLTRWTHIYLYIISSSFPIFYHIHTVAKKHVAENTKIELKCTEALQVHAIKYDKSVLKWKKKLEVEQQKLVTAREKWELKIQLLDKSYKVASNRVTNEKHKNRDLIQNHIDELANQEHVMNCTIQDLTQENFDMAGEWKEAISDKRAAEKRTKRVRAESSQRLSRWYAERDARRAAEDELARLAKESNDQKKVLDRLQQLVDESEGMRKKMKKEWDDDEAARSRGGSRRWPVWVVLLICELLVNGTPPSAIPGNIKTMYETLYGEETNDSPSLNFCRHCRLIVQVIGETMAALKLANAKEWKQIFTDATSRRQTSFLALLVGIMDDNGNIDAIVISSCIFMEDEKSETEATCVLDKVCYSTLICLFNMSQSSHFNIALCVRLTHLNIG